MIDQYATGIAMKIVLAQQAKRRDLLMFSALPDAPVLPAAPPSRPQRMVRRLLSTITAVRRRPSGRAAAHNRPDRIERDGCGVNAEESFAGAAPATGERHPVVRLPEISRV
jgi:hypothetical protein